MKRITFFVTVLVLVWSASIGLESSLAQTKPQEFDSTRFEVRASLENRTKDGKTLLVLHVNVPDGWHIYGAKNSIRPTTLSLDEVEGVAELKAAVIPDGVARMNDKGEEYWLTGVTTISQSLQIANDVKTLTGNLAYMMCTEEQCKPPANHKFTVTLGDAKPAKPENLSSVMPKSRLLTVGSVAPTLDVAHWYSTSLSDSDPITDFEQGNVYVVEFWATWCGPCIQGIPHLKQVQDKYKGQGVTVIGLTKEPTKVVEKFFERSLSSAKEERTYGEAMKAYRIGSDPDGSCNFDYMVGAGQGGIPVAFIVGKTGLIEWIGHPHSMDEVLELVVADQWDKDTFDENKKKAWKAKHEQMTKTLAVKEKVDELVEEFGIRSPAEVSKRLQQLATDSRDVTSKEMFLRAKRRFILGRLEEEGEVALYGDKDFDRAKQVAVQLALETNDPNTLSQIESFEWAVDNVIFYSRLEGEPEDDVKMLRQRVAGCNGNAEKINDLLWLLSDPANRKWGRKFDPTMISAGIEISKETLKHNSSHISLLYTLAHLHELQGELEEAIELQRKAIEVLRSPYAKGRHERHLKKLEALLEKQSR